MGEHWYTSDGKPMYEIEKVAGGLRPTTLRDARKLNLVPSVTGIMDVLAKPALTNWAAEQAALASKGMRKRKNESDIQYARRVVAKSKEQVIEAAHKGSIIHDSLENYFLGNEYEQSHVPHIEGVAQALCNMGYQRELEDGSLVPEKPFAYNGFGGKVDLHCDKVIVDFKTKDFTSDGKMPVAYDNHFMQLGAYRAGLELGDIPGLILFVSHSEPGLVHPVEISPEQLYYGYKLFSTLKSVWQILKNYTPEEV